MEILIGFLSAVLLAVFLVQIGKARELASIVRNDKNEEYEINKFQGALGVVFMLAFLGVCVWSYIYYLPYMLGWGVNTAASAHGAEVDHMFNLTLFITAIVFFLTQIALFWFAWQYRGRKNHKAIYWSHNEQLEMVWMIIPAVTMTFLVVGGLQAWNHIMGDVNPDEEYIEIEATGYQFAWGLRYPGRDGKLGAKDFRKIDATNPLGQDWNDEKNIDDFQPDKIVLPLGKKIRVRITARDVLHNFYLPQFRVKMDAVPGMPTYFVFTPTVTTDSMRRRLSESPDWQVADKNDKTKKRWETFDYELACAELCGKGHYSMRRIVKIVSPEEYEAWLDEQEKSSHYLTNVRGKDNDPFKEKGENGLLFEKLVAFKSEGNKLLEDLKTKREAARGKDKAAFEMYSNLQSEAKKIQTVLRTTMSVEDAEKSLRELKILLENAKVVSTSADLSLTVTDSMATLSLTVTDSVVVDTTKKPL